MGSVTRWNEEVDQKALATAIERRRSELGLSKLDVASEAGVTPTELSRALHGYTSLSVGAYVRLCKWLGIDPVAFLREEADR